MKVEGAPGAEWLESFLTRGHGGMDRGRARRAGWEHGAITLTAKTQSGNRVFYLALLWQNHWSAFTIDLRQCGHLKGGERARAATTAFRTVGSVG